MRPGISTNVFLSKRLSPGLLDTLVAAGAQAIELFAVRHHFDYADRDAVRELAGWFRSKDVAASLHMPLFAEGEWSRHASATLNLIAEQKPARILAMDEVKRALESAEQVPFQTCVLHLGLRGDAWGGRALDDSLTAIEHLKAFAGPLGVRLLLENLINEVATPEHLVEIVRAGHFDTVGFCLDTGHANMAAPLPETSHGPAKPGFEQAIDAFGDKLVELHLHDNHGTRDEHLWPMETHHDGSVDWGEVKRRVAALPQLPVGMLEVAHELGDEEASVAERATAAWRFLAPEAAA